MVRIVSAPEYGEPSLLRVSDSELPAEPPADRVRLRVRAAGVNPSDAKRLRGLFGRGGAPVRLGSEVAGVVTAVGAEAVGPAGPIRVGDEVVAFRVVGGFAETIDAKATAVLPRPVGLGAEAAAGLLLSGVTAWHLLEATGVAVGETVVVHGASGAVGSLAVQLARLRGARVIGTASTRSHDRLRALGAEPVPYGDGLLERLRALAPEGADVALDAAGTDEALDASVALVADRSRIATVVAFERGAELGLRVLGGGEEPGTAIRDAARLPLLELAGAGRLAVDVVRRFPLDEAAAAVALVASGRAGGTVVLVP